MKTLITTAWFALLCLSLQAQSTLWKWAKSAGGTDGDIGYEVCADDSGNVLATGVFRGPTITFGTTTLTNGGDGDIFIAKYDVLGNVLWAKQAQGNSGEEPYGITTDSSGNIFITGTFESDTLTFDSIKLFNTSYYDLFIVKYDPLGNVLWAKSAGCNSSVIGCSIVADTVGNTYLTGNFSCATLVFDSTTISGTAGSDFFVAKFDPLGNVVWAKSEGGSGNEAVHTILTDAGGNLYLSGYFNSPLLTLGTTTLASAGSTDIFVVKYDISGNVIWAKSVAGTFQEGVLDICTDISGNVYVTGGYSNMPVNFGATTITRTGDYDVFILKYDAAGNELWAKSEGGMDWDEGRCISTDPLGNLYVAGNFNSASLTIGASVLPNAGLNDIFIAKYDASGNLLLSKSVGGIYEDIVSDMYINTTGDVFLTGGFSSPSITFGSTLLSNVNNFGFLDFFVAKLNDKTVGMMDDAQLADGIIILPNPLFSGKANILSTTCIKKGTLAVYNVQGQIVQQVKDISGKSFIVNCENLPSGMYFIKVIENYSVVASGKLQIVD